MLKVQEVVNFVNKKFNELGTESGYSFDIHAEVGESQNNGKINGILYTNQASTMPIPNYTENNYSFVCELLVPSARANYHFEQIEGIVENFIKEVDGTEIEFAEGEGLLNITPSKPENFNIGYNAGENVPLFFTINVLYTEGAITSGDVHWLLNGMEIPFLNDDIIVDKEGNVNKIYGKYNTQVFLTSQTRYYRFRFPFKRKTTGDFYGLCEQLQNDLLTGNFDKQYTLTFYDGTAYTEDAPFETTVSIFKSGNASGQRGKVKIFDITFAEVDKTTNADDVKYSIALIDNPFDNQTENTRWFESQLDQQAWFNTKISGGARYERIKAPNLNSIDITSQIYPNNAGYDVFDLANKNYAIIKYEKGSGVTRVTKYFYYFVTNCQIGSNNQVLYDLKLDTIQTYYFDASISFGDCYIERSNLNRFVDGGSGSVSFDNGKNSKLFEREETTNIAKRLTKRTKLSLNNYFTQNNINKWLTDNVAFWVYAFFDPNHDYDTSVFMDAPTGVKKFKFGQTYLYSHETDIDVTTGQVGTEFAVICYPVMKTAKFLYIANSSSGNQWKVWQQGFDIFRQYNNGASYFYDIRISSVPPFNDYSSSITSENVTGTITTDGDLVLSGANWSGGNGNTSEDKDTNYTGFLNTVAFSAGNASSATPQRQGSEQALLFVSKQWQDMLTEEYFIQDRLAFAKNEIIGATKDPKFNPKLLNADYKTLLVGDESGEGYEYDLQKLNKVQFNVKVTEPFTAGLTKQYIRIKDPETNLDGTNGVYINATQNNYTGYVSNNDLSLTRATTQYQSMLANNKNFFLQNQLNRDFGTVQSAFLGGASGLMRGSASSIVTGIAGGLLSGALQSIKAQKDEAYTVDNMKNAPSSIQSAKGNSLLYMLVSNPGIYISEFDILPQEKIVVNDFMVQYGFTTNQIGQIKDYIGDTTAGHNNSRHYFNYIKAQLNSISGIPMSNVARADMRQRFAEGVRFWKQDNVDYTYENYENWLAE